MITKVELFYDNSFHFEFFPLKPDEKIKIDL